MATKLVIVAAVARNGVIGRENELPWHLPEDMKRFKALTIDHAVIMGRKTWESLPLRFRPLPQRSNFIITRDLTFRAAGGNVIHSIDEALAAIPDHEAFVIGGAEIYRETMPHADRLELTEIDADVCGDVFFPSFSRGEWLETGRLPQTPVDGLPYAFVTYERQVESQSIAVPAGT